MELLRGKVVYGPWFEKSDSMDITLLDFRESVRGRLAEIGEARTSITSLRDLFDAMPTIRPVEVDLTISTVQTLRNPVQDLLSLLADPMSLPIGIISCRFQLLVPLHSLDKEAQQLEPLIVTFRSMCLDSSNRSIRQQRAIGQRLTEIAQSSQDIEVLGRNLLDRTYWLD